MTVHQEGVEIVTSATKDQYQRAIDKASGFRIARLVRHLGHGIYHVPSATAGLEYTVRVDERGEYSCSCLAGQAGNACYHQAGVWLSRIRDQACGRPEAIAQGRVEAPSSKSGAGIGFGGPLWSEMDDVPSLAEIIADSAA